MPKSSNPNKELYSIMLNFLNFNPYFRSTAYDCLKMCPVFDRVRDKHNEDILDYIHKSIERKKTQ